MAAILDLKSISSPIALFAKWWLEEISGMIPEAFGNVFRRTDRRPVAALVDGEVQLLASKRNGSLPPLKLNSPTFGDEWAQTSKGRSRAPRPPAELHLTLPKTQCFARRLSFPASTKDNLDEILKLDVPHATPFKLDRIYHAHYVLPASASDDKSKLTVEHLVIRRDLVDEVVAQFSQAGTSVCSISVFDDNPADRLPVDFIGAPAEQPKNSPLKWINAILFMSLVVLGTIVIYLKFDSQNRALSPLDAKLEDAKMRALAVRKRLNELQQLQVRGKIATTRKSNIIEFTQILEETTRLLPDTAWLSDFKGTQKTVHITGYEGKADGLLQIIEKSPYFSSATFTAPITMDPKLQREKFSITFTLVHNEAKR